MRWGKERTVQTQFSTKLLYFVFKLDPGTHLNRAWVSCPVESQCTFFIPVFWNLFPYVTKHGVLVPSFPDFTDNFFEIYSPIWPNTGFGSRLFLTLWITFLKSLPLCDQIQVPVRSLPDFTDNFTMCLALGLLPLRPCTQKHGMASLWLSFSCN